MITAQQTNELIERRVCPLRELNESKDIPLSRLVRYWFSLPRAHSTVPKIDNVGLMNLADMGVLGWFHVISVESDDPRNFGYEVHALRSQVGYRGLRLGELPHQRYRESLQHDYQEAKAAQFPVFHQVKTELPNHRRLYRRVTLPLASSTNKVSHLLVGVHFDQ
jgi:hypothetical protein